MNESELFSDGMKLVPFFNNLLNTSIKILGCTINLDYNNFTDDDKRDIITCYERISTKLYRNIDELYEVNDINNNFITNDEMNSIIDYLINKNVVLKIDVPGIKYKLKSKYKLFLTPYGLFFVLIYLSKYKIMDYEHIKNYALEELGDSFYKYYIDRVLNFLDKSYASFKRDEIIIIFFLLITESLSKENALNYSKDISSSFQIPLNKLSIEIFDDITMFNDNTIVDNAIRRTTGSDSIESKTRCFVKEKIENNKYVIYFDMLNEQKNLLLYNLVGKIINSFKNEEIYLQELYINNMIKIIETQLTNSTFIFYNDVIIKNQIMPYRNVASSYLLHLKEYFVKQINNIESVNEYNHDHDSK